MGDMECLYAAIYNGANAVYLAGLRFGARAYAANFENDELIHAIKVAHLFGVKVYLTVNTLLKEKELPLLEKELTPLVQAGLDAFIVQDIGAASELNRVFPKVDLHGSTQMCVQSAKAANLLAPLGLKRIILPRELSLKEIRQFSKDCDLDLEAFVHGAMCYSVSGQCLFSSCLGERSANRGRCAGPCRLPYRLDKKGSHQQYLLSLKDLLAIDMLPVLSEAGVSSFKIEGRMKPPLYVATVTALYRKYLDKESDYVVEDFDRRLLECVYHRGRTRDGYFSKDTGPDMITLTDPSYTKIDDYYKEEAQKRFLANRRFLPLKMYFYAHIGEPIKLVLKCKNSEAMVLGDVAETAKSRPMHYEDIKRQLQKLGETVFLLNDLQVDCSENVFLPVSSLNELRRKGIEALEQEMLSCFSNE